MFNLIIQCLDVDDMIGVSPNIDIAKGVNKAPGTFKEAWKQYKRNKVWHKN